ncbi:MAG: hypothetical protein KTR19_02000 [Hyphomicrobiales bacterium]|nr:hypothetical protein [Hyphomicrobiales bacterium]
MRALYFSAIILLTGLTLTGNTNSVEFETPPLPVKQFQSSVEQTAVREYVAQTEAYRAAYTKYRRKTTQYWDKISSKRTARRRKRSKGGKITLSDYVLDQPPEYSGPPAPKQPSFLKRPKQTKKAKKGSSKSLPTVPDFLRYAKQHFSFVPERPADEMDYKLAYAWTALENGISKDQAVRIYGFEASGNGTYDVQAGLESKDAIAKGRKPISTALGYNQLLVANTIGLVSKYGSNIVKTLRERHAVANGARRESLEEKIAAMRRMISYAKSMPYRWSIHVRASRSSKGRALHALILDVDIGPLLQTQKLVNSIKFARRLGYELRLTAAELEMLNLTGDGNGFDMISLPQSMRVEVPTANFFQRNGYERNPVARKNNTVAELLAATDRKMDYHAALDGGRQMAQAFDRLMQRQQSRRETVPASTTQ